MFSSSPAWATELWNPHLPGSEEGLAPGAPLPPGVYGVLNNFLVSFDAFDKNGHKTGVKLNALAEVPIVVWQTGYKVLGADLSVAVAQPFDYTNLKVPGVARLSNNGHWGTFNTVLVPYNLSWTLPDDFYVSTNLTVNVDDATSSPGNPPSSGAAGSGNGYWTLEPSLGVSWLHDGWNLSMNSHYNYNFENGKTHYKSGQDIQIDYTAVKTIGKWTVGLGAHQVNQLNSDSGAGAIAAGCQSRGGCMVAKYGIGPLIGYQFGEIEIMAEYNHNIHTKNDVSGNLFNIRLVTAL